jgi:phage protein D/phage baseplate assembly protein gpV
MILGISNPEIKLFLNQQSNPMADILKESSDPISLSIKINGSTIKDTVEILSVTISKEVNRIPFAIFRILNSGVFDLLEGKFTNSESEDFIRGNSVEIEIGYGYKMEKVFAGIILSQRLVVNKDNSYIEIKCKDEAVKLTKGRFNAIYTESTDSDVISKIVEDIGLKKEIDATMVSHAQLVQHNCSYWDFILMRAEVNNLLVIPQNNTLKVKNLDLSSKPSITIQAGLSVIDADLDLDAEDIVKDFSMVSWDEKQQETNSISSKINDSLSSGNLSTSKLANVLSNLTSNRLNSTSLPKDELENIGKSAANRIVLTKIRGKVQVVGTSSINPGDFVKLTNFSSRFDGNAFVSKVEHEMEEGNWITTLYIGMSSKYHSSMPEIEDHDAGGNLPGSKSLIIGVIQGFEDDPDGNFRVKLKLPTYESEGFIWARMSIHYASANAGFFFFPEVGDEVLVGFVNSDPRYPVVMGSLYSQKNKATEIPVENNQFKSIVTKSGISIKFDDEDKILTINTPAGNQWVMNDKDKMIEVEDMNGNKLTMNDSGISMESPKDIKISAKGKISLDAIGEIGITSKADIKSAGMNINHEAKVGFKAVGNASAEISASGQTTVKGAMVMIN